MKINRQPIVLTCQDVSRLTGISTTSLYEEAKNHGQILGVQVILRDSERSRKRRFVIPTAPLLNVLHLDDLPDWWFEA